MKKLDEFQMFCVVALIVIILVVMHSIFSIAAEDVDAKAKKKYITNEILNAEIPIVEIPEEKELEQPIPELPDIPIELGLKWEEADFIATAYCACTKCCGQWAELNEGKAPIGAAGIPLKSGITVAIDNSLFEFGTVFVDDDGYMYIAADTGSAIKGYKIDIYMDDHQEAWNFGKQIMHLRWLEEVK